MVTPCPGRGRGRIQLPSCPGADMKCTPRAAQVSSPRPTPEAEPASQHNLRLNKEPAWVSGRGWGPGGLGATTPNKARRGAMYKSGALG